MTTGSVKAEACKTFPQAAPNDTDVERSIEQMKSNDPALTELNLNNIQVGRVYMLRRNYWSPLVFIV